MARVYEAVDELLDRRVAVKVLRDRFAQDPQFAQRFRREARAAAALNHPNIVQVYDCGGLDDDPGVRAFIVMELIVGPSLRERMDAAPPLTARHAASLMEQASRGLGFAHERGMVHRDVKPLNLLIDAHGTVRVADFGIARAVHLDETMTEVGSIIGTAQYVSPEQARGERVGPPSDVYSLGVVLYELLAGRAPFAGETPVEVALRHVTDAPVPVDQRNPDVPRWLAAIVDRALAKDPGERFADGYAMTDALRAGARRDASSTRTTVQAVAATRVLDRGSVPVTAPTRVTPGASDSFGTRILKRSTRIPIALMLGLLLVLGVLAVSLVSRDEPTTPASAETTTTAPVTTPAMTPAVSTSTATPTGGGHGKAKHGKKGGGKRH